MGSPARSLRTVRCALLLSAALLAGAGLRALAAEEPPAGDPLTWAQENLDAGRYREAADFLRKAVAGAEAGSAAWSRAALNLAGVLRTSGEYEEALKLCDQILKAVPADKAAACLKGELLAEVGRYHEALQVYDGVVETDPEYQRAWALRKRVAVTLGLKDVVKKTADHFFNFFNANAERFHKGEADDPRVLAYVGLGIQEENPKDAFEIGFMLAEHSAEKQGLKDPEIYVWSGQLALEVYHFGFAEARFQKAVALRRRYPDALTGLAQILLAVRNDAKKAEPLLKDALEVNPHHVEAHLTEAMLLLQDDNRDDAKRHLDAALATNPNSLDALAMLAFYYHDLKQPDQEAEVEKRVLGISPKHADYYCTLGELLESKRGFEEAPAYYRKAIALDPEYWRGYYGLGMNTSRQGAAGEEEGKRLLLKAFAMNKFNVWAANMVKALDKILGDQEQEVAPQYVQFQTKHFTVKCFAKEADIVGPYLEEWAEETYARQTRLFGFEPAGPLSVELCISFQHQAARTVGVPYLGALGVCFGKLVTLVSPREGKSGYPPFNWRRVLEHEFGHVMTLQLSQYRVPRWYTEGFSTYLEQDSRLETDQMMVDALAKGQLKPLERMNEYFKGNMLQAYVHGRYVIEYIDKTFGFEAHLKALRLFAEGQKIEDALPAATGKTLAELNAGQLEYVRNFYRQVRLRPSYDQADLARLELAASAPEATAEALAELAQAHLYMRGGKERAEAGAEKALQKDPRCVTALNVMGALAYERKDFSAAKGCFEKSTAADPEQSFHAWQRLGVIYKKEARTSKAIEALEKARQLYPRYDGEDNPHYLLPDLYLDLEPPQNEKALAVWKDAITVNTSDAEAARQGLKLAMKLKAWPAAAEFALAAIQVDPYDGETHRRAGQVFEQLKDTPRAAREYRVATVIDEKDVGSWVKLARLELARGNRDAAAQAVKAALEVDATNEEAKALRKELGLP